MNKIEIIKMTQTDLPIQVDCIRNGKEWVDYGKDNKFPNKLIDFSNRSALHNAILTSKIDMVKGKGLSYENEVFDATTEIFLQRANKYESMDEVFDKCVYDLCLFGGYAIEVCLSRDKKSIGSYNHIDFSKIRVAVEDETGCITGYWYSRNWDKSRQYDNKPIFIDAYQKPPFCEETPLRMLLYVKEYRPDTKYYPLPAYVGALSAIETDIEIDNSHLAHIKNGMRPNSILNFNNGIPNDEERAIIMRQVEQTYTGTDNAGRMMVMFNDDKNTAPSFDSLGVGNGVDEFQNLQTFIEDKILKGHRVTSPMLVGVKTPGQIGGANELDVSFRLFDSQVITPMKNMLLDTFNMFGKLAGCKELSIETVAPVEMTFSENVLLQICTINEMRERIEMEAIKTGETPVWERNAKQQALPAGDTATDSSIPVTNKIQL